MEKPHFYERAFLEPSRWGRYCKANVQDVAVWRGAMFSAQWYTYSVSQVILDLIAICWSAYLLNSSTSIHLTPSAETCDCTEYRVLGRQVRFRWLSFLMQCSGRSVRQKVFKSFRGTSLVVQWVRICLAVQGMKVQPLTGELRSHMPRSN